MSREIIGKSPAIKAMLDLIARVSNSKTNVLITGESGTGKELVARLIHESGPLKTKPFIPINCGAIPENLIESELFGHKRGSFTGAVSDKEGLFEAANGGTLFLDEIGELPLGMQVKLLRVIQERVIRKVGGNDDIKVDARIIAATNRDLEAAVARGTFREDLFYRLNVLMIKTPPLRERGGDVVLLAEKFAEKFAKKQKKELSEIDPLAMSALESYSWPGNVRELENVLERAVTLSTGNKLTLDSLTSVIQAHAASVARAGLNTSSGTGSASPLGSASSLTFELPDFSKKVDLKVMIERLEKFYIEAALERAGGKKRDAAGLLGMSLRDFTRKMTDYKLD